MKTTYQTRSRKYTRRPVKGARKNRKPFFWLLLAFIAISLAIVFLSGNQSLIRLYQLRQEKQALEQQKTQIGQDNQDLKEQIEKLQKDDEYIEKVAREKYNMKKKNEDVYVITPK
ncbi:MAG: septum formation initiator family protein [Calditrichia bacterium]